MTTVDRWDAMALQLAGEPMPAPPAIKGRVFKQPPPTDADPYAAAWTAGLEPIKPGAGTERHRVPLSDEPSAFGGTTWWDRW